MNFRKPLIIGNGGVADMAPPHTLPAIKELNGKNIDGLVLNVGLTKDSMPVIIQDIDLSTFSKIKAKLHNLSFAEIGSLDVGGWYSPSFAGTSIITLTEAFECLANLKDAPILILNILYQDKNISKHASQLIGGMVSDIHPKKVYLASTSPKEVISMSKKHPLIPVLLMEKKPFPFFRYLICNKFGNLAGAIVDSNMSGTFIADHKGEKLIFAKSTDPDILDEALSLEPNGIICDKPIESLKVLDDKWRFYA